LTVALWRALHHCRMFVPLALAAQNLDVGIRRPCRGQAFGGMLGAMARITPARPAMPRSTNAYSLSRLPKL
jgi:hypothetical protein